MKNIQTLHFSVIVVLFFICLSANAQHIDSVLTKLDREYKQEKIYLHFDRNAYTTGETIWFKAYLFTGSFPSQVSKNVYAELLDDKGKILEKKIMPVVNSSAFNSFDIPLNLSSSIVYVRAYTKWMLNFDSSYLFTKAIPVLTLKQTTAKSTTSSQKTNAEVITDQSNYFLQFFPEGGDLVQDVESRVAFKATDNKGMPIKISGDITDNKGAKILSFTSVHDGMGSFELLPKEGSIYKAAWKDRKGKSHEALLPAAKQTGVVLEINNISNQIEFKVKRPANEPLPYPYLFVVAQMNQQLIYRARINLAKTNIASSVIPVNDVPAGIVQVTLFTPDEKPVAERITFVNQSNSSFITDLNSALKDMGKRKKNVIQIDVPDTLATNLSVAVTDGDLDPLKEGDNILSDVLLTNEIKGYVHDPAYYFSSDADSVADHLDLVMMTNGWRRFKWQNVLANRWPNILYPPESYLTIQGQVVGMNKTLLANKEINAVIELKSKKREFMNAPVMSDGKFSFQEMIYYDTAKLFYQFNNDKNKSLTSRAMFDIKNNLLRKDLQLQPDSSLMQGLIKPDTATAAKNIEIYKQQLSDQELQKVKTMKEVVVTAKKKSQKDIMDEEYTSGLFSGGDSKIFLPEDDPAFLSSQTVLEYLQSRVAGLQISVSGTDATITWRGSKTALFMNEMEQQDASVIQSIPMSEIAMVKVFSPPFFGAMGAGPGGAIAIYLKKGSRGGQPAKGLDFASIPGYSPVKEFYSPDYSTSDSPDNDYRKTLYWNPFVITDKTHRRILLPFFNNDVTKKMKIIIEGCNEDGKLTRVVKILQ